MLVVFDRLRLLIVKFLLGVSNRDPEDFIDESIHVVDTEGRQRTEAIGRFRRAIVILDMEKVSIVPKKPPTETIHLDSSIDVDRCDKQNFRGPFRRG